MCGGEVERWRTNGGVGKKGVMAVREGVEG